VLEMDFTDEKIDDNLLGDKVLFKDFEKKL
jgi:hypothetical protein